jgi:pimeloyl-ACP methyl ester carboxylesterase
VTPELTPRFALAADGTRLAWYAHAGRDAAPHRRSVLLTNGLSTTDNFWRPLARALAPERRVVHWSYRGHGASETAWSGEYSIRTHADDLARVTEAALVEDASHRAPVHVAFSMGVTVLLELWRARPDLVSAMVFIAGGADHPHASSPVFRVPGVRGAIHAALGALSPLVPHVAPVARRVGASRALFPIAQAVGAIGRDAPREEVEHFFRSVGAMDLRAYWESMRSLMDAHGSDVLGTVRVPVLVVAPERDLLASRAELEALRRGVPDAEWLHVPRTSHALLLEAGDVIGARVRAFAARAEETQEKAAR